MTLRRRIISLLMLATFTILSVTGVASFFTEYSRGIATVHTVFGIVFTIVAFVHLFNNLKPLKSYARSRTFGYVGISVAAIGYFSFSEVATLKSFMDLGARSKAKIGLSKEDHSYQKIEIGSQKQSVLTLDIKRAKHFWHPQIAIWTEDVSGNYIETIFVTKATAKGIFAGGRSKENFKALDSQISSDKSSYRRVNALPVWSHKRGIQYDDELYVPTFDDPLPDAISGATPLSNFILETSVDYNETFVVKFEINVAFDDNEYYSEFDFADDETFHNGTGQLGQPSLIFASTIDPKKHNNTQLMKLQGHGHHSAQNGEIHERTDKLTTALEIIEFIVLGFSKKKN